jgi:hypothetical protein
MLLKDLRNDRDCGVNRVGNNKDESLRGRSGNASSEVADNTSIDL